MPEAPKFTAGLSISCMTVPLWLARFWSTSSTDLTQLNLFLSNEMMGSVNFAFSSTFKVLNIFHIIQALSRFSRTLKIALPFRPRKRQTVQGI